MLPFLKPRQQTGLIVSTRKPDGGSEESHTEGQEDEGLHACSEDLIKAIHSKDAHGVTAAIKAAFEILDSMPHEEGPHTNEEDSE
jgi:hypothetical protein